MQIPSQGPLPQATHVKLIRAIWTIPHFFCGSWDSKNKDPIYSVAVKYISLTSRGCTLVVVYLLWVLRLSYAWEQQP
eukprot:3067393-Amphidinium_carterae.1